MTIDSIEFPISVFFPYQTLQRASIIQFKIYQETHHRTLFAHKSDYRPHLRGKTANLGARDCDINMYEIPVSIMNSTITVLIIGFSPILPVCYNIQTHLFQVFFRF